MHAWKDCRVGTYPDIIFKDNGLFDFWEVLQES